MPRPRRVGGASGLDEGGQKGNARLIGYPAGSLHFVGTAEAKAHFVAETPLDSEQ